MRIISVAFLTFTFLGAAAQAQVAGVCVSGCNIPHAQQPQQDRDMSPQYLMGFVAEVRGDVTITYPSGRQVRANVAERTPISLGTRVSTGPGGKVVFVLLDESVFTCGPDGEMVMDEFVYDPAGGIQKASARVLRGTFRLITGKLRRKDPDALKVKLAVGDLGIRGTDVEVFASPDGSGWVELHEGEALLGEYDSDRTFELHSGQRLTWENFKIVGVQ